MADAVLAVCQGCQQQRRIRFEGGKAVSAGYCLCPDNRGPMGASTKAVAVRQALKTAAKKTPCSRGHGHPSKLEAGWCDSVHEDAAPDERVFVGPRIPLWNMGTGENGKPSVYFCPDFVVVGPGADGRPEIRRVLDAKGRRFPSWHRGKSGFQECYGVRVVEVEKDPEAFRREFWK